MATNTKNADEPYCRSALRGSEDLPELKRCGGRRRLSGPSQGDAAAKVDEDRRRDDDGGVRAQAERLWREEEEGWQRSPSGRPIYKGGLMSGRENQGDRGVVISPHNASIFGMTVKEKIRCGSGGVKNGLNGR